MNQAKRTSTAWSTQSDRRISSHPEAGPRRSSSNCEAETDPPPSPPPSSPLELRGARALVTGAGTRLGRAIAVLLGRSGLDVAVHYHGNQEGAEATQAEIVSSGRKATTLRADLSRRAEARGLVERATADLGGLDLLVVNAANFERVPFAELDDAAWDRTLELNLSSAFALAHTASPELRARRGSIVIVTCTSSIVPFRNYLPYVVSKGALSQLARVLALELAPDVRVNAVAPGTVLPPVDLPEATLARLVRTTPLARVGTPSDVAHSVLFLAQSPFITGQEIAVDGGRSLGRAPD